MMTMSRQKEGVNGVDNNTRYDLLIKNGHVIDPANKINGKMDVAVKDGIIACVAQQIDSRLAVKVVDVKGYYVIPGLSTYIPMYTRFSPTKGWPA